MGSGHGFFLVQSAFPTENDLPEDQQWLTWALKTTGL